MNKHSGRNWGILALVVGALGYLVGILTAPKSGKETRQDLKDTANRVVSEAEKKLKELHAELNVVLMDAREILSTKTGKARENLSEALENACDKQLKVKKLLSSLRDGGSSDDPELNLAIKDAKSALIHLKKYL